MSSTSFVKKWDSPEKTRVSGLPPGPDATISHTARGEVRRHDVHAINPYYKTDPSSQVPNGGVGLHIHRESKIEPKQFSGTPDYKVEKEQESYKLNIIDPKVNPHSNFLPRSNTLPSYSRKQPKSTDFPSAHSKRSFLKMTPLEPRRLRSLETKNITPHDYLSESLERHRALSMSPLRENLKVNERDVNQPWNAARRPGPKIRDPLKESAFQKTTEETRGKLWHAKQYEKQLSRQSGRRFCDKLSTKCTDTELNWFLSDKTTNNQIYRKTQVKWKCPVFMIISNSEQLSTKMKSTPTSTLHPMEPVSELEISRHSQEQKSDSAYSSQVTTAQRTPAHSHRSKQSDSPRKIFFEGRHPPSSYVGLYTQLDIPPQKLIFENQPVYPQIDAREGRGTDIVPAKVHHLREKYQSHADDGRISRTEIIVTPDYQLVPEGHETESRPQITMSIQHGNQRNDQNRLIAEQHLNNERIRIEQELLEVENKRRMKELQLAQQRLQQEQQNLELKLHHREQADFVQRRNIAEIEQRNLLEQDRQNINDERKRTEHVHFLENQLDQEQRELQLKMQDLQRQKEAYERQQLSSGSFSFVRMAPNMEQYRPPPNVNDSSSWQYTTSNNFSPRSLISINGHHTHDDHHHGYQSGVQGYTLEQTRTVPQQQMWPFPAVLVPVAPSGTFTYEVKEEKKSNTEFERRPRYYEDDGSRQSTMIKVKDASMKKPKPKSIIKQLQKENWESHRHESSAPEIIRQVVPKISETTATTEETKRTEEVERRVLASEKKKSKQKRLGNRSYVTHTVHSHQRVPRHGEPDYPPINSSHGDWREHAITQTGHRSGDSYHRDTGSYASRHGKLSDRGREEDFYTNGSRHGYRDVRKTHSSRDIYGNDDNYVNGPRPIIEYPPTLPRSEDHYTERGVRRSNSMNDWSLQPRYYQDPGMMTRYGEMGDLEREFRDTLSMPLPHGQNINEREYREERIPGGHESFSREVKAHTGSRQNNPNDITHFSESKQEVSFKREQALDR